MLSSIFLIFAAIAYMALRLFFNERLAQIHVYSDEENLTHLTQARGVSAYQLFYIAGNAWNQTESKIETDFKDYLKTSNQPHYVRDFIRKKKLPRAIITPMPTSIPSAKCHQSGWPDDSL